MSNETSIQAALQQLRIGHSDDEINLDILTEDEKQDAIEWAIKQEKIHYRRKMGNLLVDEKIFDLITQEQWLEKINPEKVLKSAANRKKAAIDTENERKRQKEALKSQQMVLNALYDAGKFLDIIKTHFDAKNGKFILGAWNKPMIEAICDYMAGNQQKKGLMIIGQSGLGKTETIRAVAKNPVKPIQILSILEVAEVVKDHGSCDLNESRHILIDDVGSEPEVINYFGTKIQWFKEFIESYYLNHKTYEKLLITTNLSGQEVENRYGYRVRSRLREMMNIVTIQGEDLRG